MNKQRPEMPKHWDVRPSTSNFQQFLWGIFTFVSTAIVLIFVF